MMDQQNVLVARDVLRRILAAVEDGELTVDGPMAAGLMRRLEGAELTLSAVSSLGLPANLKEGIADGSSAHCM